MADGRIIEKKISVSDQVSELTTFGQLLYTWMIPHADDFGLLPFSSKTIKGLVVPINDDFTWQHVEAFLQNMLNLKLIEIIDWEGERFYHLTGFNIQKLRKDIKPHVIAKNISEWSDLDKILKRIVAVPSESATTRNETERIETKRSNPSRSAEEDKIREDKISEDILISGGKPPGISKEPREKPKIPITEMPLSEKMGPLAENLQKKYGFILKPASKSGISTEHQEKAFRYAKDLGISLKDPDTGRWIKIFNQAAAGRKPANLETAYGYCRDHPEWESMDNPARMNLFFAIYERGLDKRFLNG